MKYEDEIIAILKKKQRDQKYTDIRGEGLYINDRFIRFCPRQIYDMINIYMPEEFIEMPREIQMRVYPSINRPQIILTSLDCCVHFAFNLIHDKVTKEQLPDLVVQIENIIKKLNPSIEIQQDIESTLPNGQRIHIFDYIGFGVDGRIYNMVCFVILNCGILHGVFSCPDEETEGWKGAAWQVFQTISE